LNGGIGMTRAQLMNTALPTIEGLYAAYPSFFGPNAVRPWSFCVIGPTREELEALAPTVVDFLDEPYSDSHPSGLHLPVHEGDSLRKIVEDYWEWVEDYYPPWGLCIVLPENVKADWPDGQRVLKPGACKSLHPTLLLADLLNQALPGSLVALPDSALLDANGRAQRSLMGQAVFRFNRPDLLSKAVPKFAEVQSGRKSNLRDSSSLSERWLERDYDLGLCPRFVWAHEVDGCAEAVSVAHLSYRDDDHIHCDGVKAPLATHLRRLNSKMVRDLQSNPAAIERLGRVAFGEIERGDDDRFVPRWELGPSGNWGAAGGVDRDLAGFREITSTRGFELRRIDNLARIEVVHNWSPGESRPGTLWFVAEGTDVLRCLRTAPCPPAKERNESDEEHRGKLDAWHSHRDQIRLFTLCGAEDAEYLWLAMGDDVLFENLRCRAAKSYWAPSVSTAVLAETLIPWPSKDERQRVAKVFSDSAAFVEKDELGGLIQELEDSWELRQRRFAPHNFNKVCARDVSDEWDYMIENARVLLTALEKLKVDKASRPPEDSESEPAPAPPAPPAPIAIARRQLANEINPSRRIRASLDLAQVTMELDAAIMLSLLRQIDPSQVTDVWKKLSLSLKHGDVSLALGHKRTLAQAARRALSSSVKTMTIDPWLRDLVIAACKVDSKAWNSVVEDILKFRNDNFGHGFQLPAAAEPPVADWLMKQVEALVGLVRYMERYMLVYLESRSIGRQQTECIFRFLVHDNPLFPRHSLPRLRGTVMDTYNEHEVYVYVAAPDEFLSLWPWVIFQPSSQGQEAIWFFDGTKSGAAVYKSVLVPGACTTDKSAGLEVLKLLSV
jgi:hypothetical protein